MQNNEIELDTYDKLSVQYFYMGKIHKSQEYHNRYLSGYLEPKESGVQSLTMLKYQNKVKDQEKRTAKVLDYKAAIKFSAGYLKKIKQILNSEEQSNLILTLFHFEDGFKIRIPTPVPKIDVKDLPSPTALTEDIESKEIRRSLLKHQLHRSKNQNSLLTIDTEGNFTHFTKI